MSYQLVEVTLQNTARFATATEPLYIDLGAITGNDASFLRVSAVVGAFAGTFGSLELEQSHDGGITWVAVASPATTFVATGTYTIESNAVVSVLSPNVRLKITTDGGVGLNKLFKTFSPGPIVPVGSGGATEATALDILADTTAILADTTAILADTNALVAKDFATETTSAAILADTNALVAKDFATETTSAAILADTNALVAKDFATETTSAAILADTNALVAKDFATETTSAAILADTAAILLDTTALVAKDFATETTSAAILADTNALVAKDFATETTSAAILADTTALVAKDFALEATQQKLRAWPYTNHDYIGDVFDSGTFTETITYKTGGSGGTTVGTIVLVFTDDTKEQLVSVTFSPEKSV